MLTFHATPLQDVGKENPPPNFLLAYPLIFYLHILYGQENSVKGIYLDSGFKSIVELM